MTSSSVEAKLEPKPNSTRVDRRTARLKWGGWEVKEKFPCSARVLGGPPIDGRLASSVVQFTAIVPWTCWRPAHAMRFRLCLNIRQGTWCGMASFTAARVTRNEQVGTIRKIGNVRYAQPHAIACVTRRCASELCLSIRSAMWPDPSRGSGVCSVVC